MVVGTQNDCLKETTCLWRNYSNLTTGTDLWDKILNFEDNIGLP